MTEEKTKVEFIESYIKIGNSDYKWNDNHGELIRCKDCKHWNRRECGSYGTCESENMNICGFTDADWFCADGARRQSE